MNPHEFIQKNIERELIKDGFSAGAAFSASLSALDLYKQKSSFKKGPIDECLKHARSKAIEIDGKKPRKMK